MKRNNVSNMLVVILVAVILLVSASISKADTDQLDLTNLPNMTYAGYYVGPSTGNINNGSSFGLICDDFSTETYIPGSFLVTITTFADLSNAKFDNQSNALFKYEEASWLFYQIGDNQSETGNINFAIWSLFDSNAPNVGQQNWLNAASNIDFSDYDFSNISIYTPIPAYSNQEFIGGNITPRISVQEPNSLFLIILGFGMIGIYVIRNKKVVLKNA
jgi:hypothetical protein